MCGIVAAWSARGPVNRPAFAQALDRLHHRGPDARGVWFSEDGRVALGHTRLSIIDLATGDQPIADRGRRLHLIANGELYDHERIRADLMARGFPFRTRSDGEIALHLYDDVGARCVEDLRGEFAFVIWNGRERTLFAARDRFGIKPLYYAATDNGIFLASEIKALLALGIAAAWDAGSYLEGAHALRDRTLFAGIHQVPPAHLLLATEGGVRLRRYWDHPLPGDAGAPADQRPATAKAPDEAPGEIRAQLAEAVRLRLRADVPVACYLSGGIDSASVLTLATREAGRAPDAFCIAYGDQVYDEAPLAERIAAHAGARFHRVPVTDAALADAFAASLWHTETTCFNPHGTAKFLLSRAVRDAGFKVVLTGEGSDELFGGYAPSQLDAATPGMARATIEASNRATYAITPRHVAERDVSLVVHALGSAPHWLGHQIAQFATLSELFRDEWRRDWTPARPLRAFLDHLDRPALRGLSALDLGLALMLRTTLPNYVLPVLGDRVEMAHSVEGRVPFLDHHLAAAAWRLPAHLKVRGGCSKYALREAMRPLLPAEVVDRAKHPFVAPPTATDPTGPFGTMIWDLLRGSDLAAVPFFDPARVATLLQRLPGLPDDERLRYEPVLIEMASLCALQRHFRPGVPRTKAFVDRCRPFV